MPEKENNSDDNVNYKSEFSKEDEINLLEYWQVIWKRRKLIGYIVAATVVLTAVYSLTMTNIYGASAVITPVELKSTPGGTGAAAALIQQMGSLTGIGLPDPASSVEIMLL